MQSKECLSGSQQVLDHSQHSEESVASQNLAFLHIPVALSHELGTASGKCGLSTNWWWLLECCSSLDSYIPCGWGLWGTLSCSLNLTKTFFYWVIKKRKHLFKQCPNEDVKMWSRGRWDKIQTLASMENQLNAGTFLRRGVPMWGLITLSTCSCSCVISLQKSHFPL